MLKLLTKLSPLIATLIFLSGCILPEPLPPAKPAIWYSSPDFSPNSISKIAIIIDGGKLNGDPFLSTIEDTFIQEAFQKGYRVCDRSDVQRVLQEIHFQESGLTEADASQLGRMLNVPAVLLVKITGTYVSAQTTGLAINNQYQYYYTAKCQMDVRLIGVESAEVLGLSKYYAENRTDRSNNLGPALGLAATELAAALPARGSP